ncbi:hypothetical protein IJG29_01325 [Candidatus Saccharibacteria bacterium]|nr:hypothetical protein [Candidatus Saccharibacteria bacterium]
MAKTLVYQIWPGAWTDLREMAYNLPKLASLGVDYVWLSPIYPSPGCDHGYDVADYCGINRRYGSIYNFDQFVTTAHHHGIKVLMDLVLNHTSVMHPWFKDHPEYYVWRDAPITGWHNLFDGGSSWKQYGSQYYLHLFHEQQADLNWFINGNLSDALVDEFRAIVRFWVQSHNVDGFRLDCPQAINKDFGRGELRFDNLLAGDKAIRVINAIFTGGKPLLTTSSEKPLLITELFDPTYGDLVAYYADQTPIDFVQNVIVKDAIEEGLDSLLLRIDQSVVDPAFMLDLESHDAPRFTSRSGLSLDEILPILFSSEVQAVCLYQGQELGLTNPDELHLPNLTLLALDARAKMQYERGVSIDEIRVTARSNARTRYPINSLAIQFDSPHSNFGKTRTAVRQWKAGADTE